MADAYIDGIDLDSKINKSQIMRKQKSNKQIH